MNILKAAIMLDSAGERIQAAHGHRPKRRKPKRDAEWSSVVSSEGRWWLSLLTDETLHRLATFREAESSGRL